MFRFLAESCYSNLIGTREKAIVFNTDVIFEVAIL